jgi:putative hydrolase of the HAD superfamily
MTRAVFFDVDFTLIRPGPTFRAEGYRDFAARHDMSADPQKFEAAVSSAAALLDGPDDAPYDDEIFVAYTRRILELMGAEGASLDACAREMYAEWASCHHFELYDEVPEVLRALDAAGVRVGLISNSHRCLTSFQMHFELQGLIAAAVSSSEHGLMKPHPSIFSAALQLLGVEAAESVMVGDSVRQDVNGALRAGMRAVLLHRGEDMPASYDELDARGVRVIRTLRELPPLVIG